MIFDDAPITDLLFQIKEGNREAEDRLMQLTDKILCRMARRYLAALPRPHHTLQPADIVNEYVLIAKKYNISYQSRAHFFAVAAKVMRHILADYERRRNAQKREGRLKRIPLEDVSLPVDENAPMRITLHELLKKLEARDPRACKILELAAFEGLSVEQIEATTGWSRSTVIRDLRFARAWLQSCLDQKP